MSDIKLTEPQRFALRRAWKKSKTGYPIVYLPRVGIKLLQLGLIERDPEYTSLSCDFRITKKGAALAAELEKGKPVNQWVRGFVCACAMFAKLEGLASEGARLMREGGMSFEKAREDADEEDLRTIYPEEFSKEPL